MMAAQPVDALPLYWSKGQREGSILYHGGDGFFYHVVNMRNNRRFVYLRCMHADRTLNPCSGTAKALFGRGVLIHLKRHDHNANVWHPLTLHFRQAVVERVRSGDQTAFHEIVQQEGQRYPVQARAQMTLGTLEARLNLIRAGLRPAVPRSLGVLGACLLLPQYQYLTRILHVPDTLFLGACGNMADQTLSLVFISQHMMQFMQTRNTVFADGTERKKFSKPKCSQIFSIVGVWRYHVIPMLRALMLRRTSEAYITLFQFLRRHMPNFRPKYIKCDFEDAQINAWRFVFPRATVEGCLWHYAVAVFLKGRKLGLSNLVREQPEVASIVRSCCALPLLPSEDIEAGLEALGWEARDGGWMIELRPFFQYMETEWLPKVPVLSVKGSVHRTNNASESGNRGLNKEIKVSRPSCFHVLRAFVVTNDRATNDLHILAAGLSPGRRRKLSALRNDVKIRNLTTDYENEDITILEFLHRASRRLQSVFNKIFK